MEKTIKLRNDSKLFKSILAFVGTLAGSAVGGGLCSFIGMELEPWMVGVSLISLVPSYVCIVYFAPR